MLMAFLVNFGLTSFQGVFGLFALEKFSYGPQQVGTILMAFGLVSSIVQGLFAGRLINRWGEVSLVKASLLISSAGYLTMLFAGDYPSVLLTTGFFALGTAMLQPGISALTSRRATMGQGTAMGLSNSFMSLGRTIGPLWAGFIFDVNLVLPFISGAAVMFIGFLVSLFWLLEHKDTVHMDRNPLAEQRLHPGLEQGKMETMRGGTELYPVPEEGDSRGK